MSCTWIEVNRLTEEMMEWNISINEMLEAFIMTTVCTSGRRERISLQFSTVFNAETIKSDGLLTTKRKRLDIVGEIQQTKI